MQGNQLALSAPQEELPFLIRIARSARDLAEVCRLRTEAYSRHNYTQTLPGRLAQLDDYDRRAIILIALDKLTGRAVGSLRISLTTRGEPPVAPYEPLGIVQGTDFAYIDRFAIEVASNHVTLREALMKAMWLLVCDRGVPWVVASAMAPLARLYRGVGLRPIPGAEQGFLHPKLHDTALYYMCGGRTADLLGNVQLSAPARAHWFARVNHPDIEVPWPPAPGWLRVGPPAPAASQPEPVAA